MSLASALALLGSLLWPCCLHIGCHDEGDLMGAGEKTSPRMYHSFNTPKASNYHDGTYMYKKVMVCKPL